MIMRIWRGVTRAHDRHEYGEYVRRTGWGQYRSTPGNRAAFLLSRLDGERSEVVTISVWDSLDAVRKFAGEDYERAVYYPDDDKYLLYFNPNVEHYEIVAVRELIDEARAARTWAIQTPAQRTDDLAPSEQQGLRRIAAAGGDLAMYLGRRIVGSIEEWILVTLWASIEAAERANTELERAVSADERDLLLNLNPTVSLYNVDASG